MTGPWNELQHMSSERALPPYPCDTHTAPHAIHTLQGCHTQVSPSDRAAVPHLQELALNTPQKAVHGLVWLWNDEVTVSIKMVSSIPHTLEATSNHQL